jgi:hypothetical protein
MDINSSPQVHHFTTLSGNEIFAVSLDILFNQWTTLVLAVEQNLGGPNSSEKES